MLKPLCVMRKLLSEKVAWFSILMGLATAWALALVVEPRPRLEMNIDFMTQTMDATSQDRRFLAMVNRDASEVEVWDVTKGRIHQTLRLDRRTGTYRPPIECRSVPTRYRAFAHDNKSFALLGGGEIFVWDVDSGDLKSTHRLPDRVGNASVLNFDRSGRLVLAIPSNTDVKLWDVTEERVFMTLDRRPHPVEGHTGIAHLDQGCLVNWENDKSVKVWDLATGEWLFQLPEKDRLGGLLLSADRSKLVMEADTGERRVIDLKTGTERTFQIPAGTHAMDVSSDGTKLIWFEFAYDDTSHPIVKWLAGLLPGRPRASVFTHILDLTTGEELGAVPGSGFLIEAQPLLTVWDDANRLLVYDLPVPSRWPWIVGYACLVAVIPCLFNLLFCWLKSLVTS